MGHKYINEGGFVPETIEDRKLFIANEMALAIRTAINKELGYTASCGISHNKTVAKIACAANKPNGMTVVPQRYFLKAMSGVPVK